MYSESSDDENENYSVGVEVVNKNKKPMNLLCLQDSEMYENVTDLTRFLDCKTKKFVIDFLDKKMKTPTKREPRKNYIEEKKYIQQLFNVSKKTLINCPFHPDSRQSAIIYDSCAFKCFSTNCEFGNKFLKVQQFASLIRERMQK